MMERRRESRPEAEFSLRVWGADCDGRYFSQEVEVSNISVSGALFSRLDQELKAGDLIGVEYLGKKARFRVVWVRDSGNHYKVQAAVHRFKGDACPWLALLPAQPPADSSRIHPSDEEVRKSQLADGLVYNPTPVGSTAEAGDIANVLLPLSKNTAEIDAPR